MSNRHYTVTHQSLFSSSHLLSLTFIDYSCILIYTKYVYINVNDHCKITITRYTIHQWRKSLQKQSTLYQRFGERIERRLSTGDADDDDQDLNRSGSAFKVSSSGSAFHRPLDKKRGKDNHYSSKQRDASLW